MLGDGWSWGANCCQSIRKVGTPARYQVKRPEKAMRDRTPGVAWRITHCLSFEQLFWDWPGQGGIPDGAFPGPQLTRLPKATGSVENSGRGHNIVNQMKSKTQANNVV